MALQPTLTPYIRNLSVLKNARSFAAAASQAAAESDYGFKPREDVKTSKGNNVVVSSVETNKPISKLAIYYRAGSRFETDETQGVAHMLRIAAGLGTSGSTQYGLTRNIEQGGGNLYCAGGREFISYTIEGTRDKIDHLSRFLAEVALNQVFKPWEIADNVPRMRLERAIRPPEVRVLELLHKAAYRKGLGYSLYSPKWMIGNHSSEMLQDFVSNTFGQAAVVGVGLPHDKVKEFASRLNLETGSPSKGIPAKYNGGSEVRKETNDSMAYVAIAIEGAGITNGKGHVASALAQRLLGAGARTKRGLNSSGKIVSSVVSGNEDVMAATSFSASYMDSGLLGVYVAAPPDLIDQGTRKAADALKTLSASEEDTARAKGILKADLAHAADSDSGTLEDIGLQSLLTGKVATTAELHSLIDSVTANDINEIIKKGKLSMAAFGSISKVPHIDELK